MTILFSLSEIVAYLHSVIDSFPEGHRANKRSEDFNTRILTAAADFTRHYIQTEVHNTSRTHPIDVLMTAIGYSHVTISDERWENIAIDLDDHFQTLAMLVDASMSALKLRKILRQNEYSIIALPDCEQMVIAVTGNLHAARAKRLQEQLNAIRDTRRIKTTDDLLSFEVSFSDYIEDILKRVEDPAILDETRLVMQRIVSRL